MCACVRTCVRGVAAGCKSQAKVIASLSRGIGQLIRIIDWPKEVKKLSGKEARRRQVGRKMSTIPGLSVSQELGKDPAVWIVCCIPLLIWLLWREDVYVYLNEKTCFAYSGEEQSGYIIKGLVLIRKGLLSLPKEVSPHYRGEWPDPCPLFSAPCLLVPMPIPPAASLPLLFSHHMPPATCPHSPCPLCLCLLSHTLLSSRGTSSWIQVNLVTV